MTKELLDFALRMQSEITSANIMYLTIAVVIVLGANFFSQIPILKRLQRQEREIAKQARKNTIFEKKIKTQEVELEKQHHVSLSEINRIMAILTSDRGNMPDKSFTYAIEAAFHYHKLGETERRNHFIGFSLDQIKLVIKLGQEENIILREESILKAMEILVKIDKIRIKEIADRLARVKEKYYKKYNVS